MDDIKFWDFILYRIIIALQKLIIYYIKTWIMGSCCHLKWLVWTYVVLRGIKRRNINLLEFYWSVFH